MKLSILNKLQEITKSGLDMMENKTLDKFEVGVVYYITEIGYMKDAERNEDYVVLADKEHFYYGGMAITKTFQTVEETLSTSELKEVLKAGLAITFEEKMSKNKRNYTICSFVEDDEQVESTPK